MSENIEEVIIPDPTPTESDSHELRVLRKQTTFFINENPEQITILRGGTRQPDGAGGFTVEPGDPIPTQTFRLIIQGGNVASRNIDGEDIHPAYVLIGQWDASIKHKDVFIKDDRNYEVMFVREDRRYETWAEVVYRG